MPPKLGDIFLVKPIYLNAIVRITDLGVSAKGQHFQVTICGEATCKTHAFGAACKRTESPPFAGSVPHSRRSPGRHMLRFEIHLIEVG